MSESKKNDLQWGYDKLTFENRTNKCPVFEWRLKTGPFGNRPNVNHLKTGQVWFLDPQYINLMSKKLDNS